MVLEFKDDVFISHNALFIQSITKSTLQNYTHFVQAKSGFQPDLDRYFIVRLKLIAEQNI